MLHLQHWLANLSLLTMLQQRIGNGKSASVHRSVHSWIRTDINCRLQAQGPPRPGVVGSLAVSRLVNSFLFGVSAIDPFVYAAAAVTMMVMALLASALPALRAASADPIDALRSS
jgi:ABC-type antimicrobial peptide transport system permease subunit